jgi:hypothetical protein
MTLLAKSIINFYRSLEPPQLPKGIDILFPQKSEEVMKVVETFFYKFYNDTNPRHLIFGINPGRFGAGTTGINFTAPKQLKEICGIDHCFKSQTELSAEFIYESIQAFGGIKNFYENYFITSVSPLGFVTNGVNLNYYDDKRSATCCYTLYNQQHSETNSIGIQNGFLYLHRR